MDRCTPNLDPIGAHGGHHSPLGHRTSASTLASDVTSSSTSSLSTTDLALLASYPVPASSPYPQPSRAMYPSFSPDPDIDPSSTFDAWASAQTPASVLVAFVLFLRLVYHLSAFTAGLYLASGVFTTLAPLLDSSLAWVPLVLTASIVATLAAPFWGLAVSYIARRLFSLASPSLLPWHTQSGAPRAWDAHTRRCVLAILVGLGLAVLRLAVALLVLTGACHPTGGWGWGTAQKCTAQVLRAISASWDDILARLCTAVAVTFAPLAAAWFLTWRLKPDPAPRGRYVILALKTATVVLTLTQIYLTLAVGSQNVALRGEVEMCRLLLEGSAEALLRPGPRQGMGVQIGQVVIDPQ